MRIGIIDSGLNNQGGYSVAGFYNFTVGDARDKIGHGSDIVYVITSHTLNCDLYIAKVFDEKPVCTAATVAAALDWLRGENVNLVNMSFGLKEDRDVLAQSCARATEENIILVAASPARGAEVYPGAYPGVIRATGDARCSPKELSALNTSQADYGGCVRYPGVSTIGSSIGCASVSGIIASLVWNNRHRNLRELMHDEARYHGAERHYASGLKAPSSAS